MNNLLGIILSGLVAGLGIASNLFNSEIRCCLGIDTPCPQPQICVQIKCLLGINSNNQCPNPLDQYKKCKERFDSSQCRGILTADGKCYVNEMRQKYQGQGFLLIFNGDECYVGQFQAGKFNGDGLLLYKDATIYQGKFYDGKRHGQGKMLDPNNAVIYEGTWINDRHE